MPSPIITGVQKAAGKTKNMATPYTLKSGDLGIDVSHNNGVIDWAKVASDPQGIKFAILKASEGSNSKDSKRGEYYKGAKEAGLLVSFYHFATWNSQDVVNDAKIEAANFLDAASNMAGDLPLILDTETNKPLSLSKDKVLLFINTFFDEIQQAGFEVGLYASPGFLQSYLPKNHNLGNFKIWIADYTGAINPVPGINKFWIRQTTDKGKVNGINGTVDIDVVL